MKNKATVKMFVQDAVDFYLRWYKSSTSKITLTGNSLIYAVQADMGRVNRYPRDGTIMRELRSLRKDGYDIECIDTRKSIYRISKRDN